MQEITKQILDGKIFVYPTDTIYGIGCNALNKKSVEKIKEIKGRDSKKPLSVIAPSFEWIEQNCVVDFDIKKYLPGPYTLILKKKDKNFLSYVSDTDSIGIRIPSCNFTKEVEKARVPFITTSVNLSGEPFARNVKEVPQKILNHVDRIIDDGDLKGKPSTLIINGKEITR